MKFALCGVLCVVQFVFFAEAHSIKSKQRILGGQSVNIESYPYQISMRRYNYAHGQYEHYCGGSIVSERHIVTAAHCLNKELDRLQNILIFTGTGRSDTGSQYYSIYSVVLHPDYSAEPNHFNDIAIVTLSNPIVFSATQGPIALPTSNILNGAAATVTGWGYTSAVNTVTPIYLQQAPMTLVNIPTCQSIVPSQPLQNTQVCAIRRAGTGICNGDSGGPLVSNGRLVGVASYVLGCGQSNPDVYTNVYAYLDFIKWVMNAQVSYSQNSGQLLNNGQGQCQCPCNAPTVPEW